MATIRKLGSAVKANAGYRNEQLDFPRIWALHSVCCPGVWFYREWTSQDGKTEYQDPA